MGRSRYKIIESGKTYYPQILEKNGKKEFAIFPYEDFLKMREELECYNDLRILREAKQEEQNASSVSLEEAKNILNIK